MQNYKMLIEYDGTRYQGFQGKGASIAPKLQDAILRVTGEQTEVHAAVRTSPGVHALGQTVSFRLPSVPKQTSSGRSSRLPSMQQKRSVNVFKFQDSLITSEHALAQMRQKLNRALPQDIAIRNIYPADERFHAALHLKSATLECRLDVGETPNVFWRNRSAHVPEPLHLGHMEAAAKLLCGAHDFGGFSAGRTKKSTVRCITELSLHEEPEVHQLVFTLTADGFLRHMPQLLIGTLVDVGRGKIEPQQMEQIFDGTCPCGEFLPSKAFCLTETNYL